MFHSMRRLGLVAAGVAAGLTLLSGASQALQISFTAQAFDSTVINSGLSSGAGLFYLGAGGISPVPSNVSALLVNYSTSGLDYYVSQVQYDSTTSGATMGGTTFVPDAGSGTPVTLASIAAGETSTNPAAGATISGGGKLLTQTFTNGEFQQGPISGEFTYVEIDNANGAITGASFPTPPPALTDPHDLLEFNGTKVTVTFTLKPGGTPTTLGNQFTLTSNFAVQTTGQGVDLGYHNTALAGASTNAELVTVPEPGTLALFIGMGISGSGLLLRRRRR
jgi:hypothetical protein